MNDKKCSKCKNTYTDNTNIKRCVFNDAAVEDREAPRICVDRGDYSEIDERTPNLFEEL